METDKINRSAFNFSPHFWWKYMERAVALTEAFGKELIPDFNFRKWLLEDCIEHTSLDLYDENLHGLIINDSSRDTMANDYFYQVGAVNKHGHKMKERTVERLFAKHDIDKDAKLSYIFKIDDLNHFATCYFMKWLVNVDEYNYIRWELYCDFITSKLNESQAELYHYMWSVLLAEVNFNHQFFGSVEQYKKFRDRLEEVNKKSDGIESKIAALRNSAVS